MLGSFYARKQVLLSARLSHRNSVRLSVTRVDQSKTVQARITNSLPSAAWRTLVSGAIKLFLKLEGGHPKQRREMRGGKENLRFPADTALTE